MATNTTIKSRQFADNGRVRHTLSGKVGTVVDNTLDFTVYGARIAVRFDGDNHLAMPFADELEPSPSVIGN